MTPTACPSTTSCRDPAPATSPVTIGPLWRVCPPSQRSCRRARSNSEPNPSPSTSPNPSSSTSPNPSPYSSPNPSSDLALTLALTVVLTVALTVALTLALTLTLTPSPNPDHNPAPNQESHKPLSETHEVVYLAAGRYNLLAELGSGLGRYDLALGLSLSLTFSLA